MAHPSPSESPLYLLNYSKNCIPSFEEVLMGQCLKYPRANLLYFVPQLHLDLYFILLYRVALVMMDLLAVMVLLV